MESRTRQSFLRHTPVSMTEEAAPKEEETGDIHRRPSEAYERTWELELLISGAVTFALLQLPSVVDGWFGRVQMQVVGTSAEVVFFTYFYAKMILYTLIASFIIHLSARAYWVGLVGLDTAFPAGVVWERLTAGDIGREFFREKQPSLEVLIRRVDRFCNIIFSFAFTVVFLFLFSILAAGAVGLLGLGISTVAFGGARTAAIVQALFFVLAVLPMALTLIDRRMSGKLDRSRGLGRVVHRGIGILYALQLGVAYVPVFNVLVTNLRKTAVYAALIGVFVGAGALMLTRDLLIPTGRLAVSGYEYLPDADRADAVDYRAYDDLRPQGVAAGALPAIQSEVIRDPFVRLFIPYLAPLHRAAVARACPAVRPLAGTGLRLLPRNPPPVDPRRVAALFACLSRLQPVRLNGRPVQPRYRLYAEPGTDRRGIVAFIPTVGLPEGENLLTVGAVATTRQPNAPPYQIPFWVQR
jgi:hypothetical protein